MCTNGRVGNMYNNIQNIRKKKNGAQSRRFHDRRLGLPDGGDALPPGRAGAASGAEGGH